MKIPNAGKKKRKHSKKKGSKDSNKVQPEPQMIETKSGSKTIILEDVEKSKKLVSNEEKVDILSSKTMIAEEEKSPKNPGIAGISVQPFPTVNPVRDSDGKIDIAALLNLATKAVAK